MNFDTLFVSPAGRTARAEFVGALVTLLAAFAFYYFLVPGRNSQWVQLVFLFPAVVLLARRLHDMGRTAWPLVVPAALIVAMAWLYLYVPGAEMKVLGDGNAERAKQHRNHEAEVEIEERGEQGWNVPRLEKALKHR